MANYVVGDIQGCYSGLKRLLTKAEFNRKKDKLWAVGDLVARGEESLQTLAYLYQLEDAFDTVLGNHDLHFLAIYSGIRNPKRMDLLEPLLDSPNVDRYVEWLRHKPLALQAAKDMMISHAGLYPKWSIKQALALSQEVQDKLTGKDWQKLLAKMYGNDPNYWSDDHSKIERLRFIINAFTRMRFLKTKQKLEFDCKTAPGEQDSKLTPWFTCKNSDLKANQSVIFGHWAALNGQTGSKQFIGLDTGYVWGGKMSLLHLESGNLIQVNA